MHKPKTFGEAATIKPYTENGNGEVTLIPEEGYLGVAARYLSSRSDQFTVPAGVLPTAHVQNAPLELQPRLEDYLQAFRNLGVRVDVIDYYTHSDSTSLDQLFSCNVAMHMPDGKLIGAADVCNILRGIPLK